MNRTRAGVVVGIAGLVLIAGLTGCSKKAVQAPPVAAVPPAAPVAQETPAAPAVPAPAAFRAEDLVPVFFEFDSYALTASARAALDRNAKVLREAPEATITIEGHCDERGTVEYNQALGERRAQAVRDYLAAAGIAGSRIAVVSYGKERPFDEGQGEAAWAKNRRAHPVAR